MFLDTIRNLLCSHSNESFKLDQSHLVCTQCGHRIDVYATILNPPSENPFLSSQWAHSFAAWSGDVHVPCTFSITPIPGVLPKRVVTRLSTLINTRNLLKRINSPFFSDHGDGPVPEGLFKQFMAEYLHLIDRIVEEETTTDDTSKHETMALQAVLTNMKNAFTEVDLFDQYFNLLVPYVQRCTESQTFASEPPRPHNVGYELYAQMKLSTQIRQRFSPYCILFDIVHVMVLCYLCGQDSDVVANLVFDFSARLCKGYFGGTFPPLTQTLATVLEKEVTPTHHLDWYYNLRAIRNGEAEAHFSEKFIRDFSQLDETLRNTVSMDDPHSKFAYQQTFPYLLFSNDADYFGFVLAMAHYAFKSNGRIEKGTLKASREIYRFVKTLVRRIAEFDRGGDLLWTKETFHLFLCADSGFEKEFGNVLKTMMQDFSNHQK